MLRHFINRRKKCFSVKHFQIYQEISVDIFITVWQTKKHPFFAKWLLICSPIKFVSKITKYVTDPGSAREKLSSCTVINVIVVKTKTCASTYISSEMQCGRERIIYFLLFLDVSVRSFGNCQSDWNLADVLSLGTCVLDFQALDT